MQWESLWLSFWIFYSYWGGGSSSPLVFGLWENDALLQMLICLDQENSRQHFPFRININIKPSARQEAGGPSQTSIQFSSFAADVGFDLGLALGCGLGPIDCPLPRVRVRVVVVFVNAGEEARSSSSSSPPPRLRSPSDSTMVRGRHSNRDVTSPLLLFTSTSPQSSPQPLSLLRRLSLPFPPSSLSSVAARH